jgi:hypothetical protein
MKPMLIRLTTVSFLIVTTAVQAQTAPLPPTGVTEKEFATLRTKCAQEWSDDYQMRNYCEEKQIEALRKLKSRGLIEQK